MQSFCDAFQRNADGSWICLERASLRGPGARIDASPGEIYTGDTDVAEFLDVEDAVRAQTAAVIKRRRK